MVEGPFSLTYEHHCQAAIGSLPRQILRTVGDHTATCRCRSAKRSMPLQLSAAHLLEDDGYSLGHTDLTCLPRGTVANFNQAVLEPSADDH